MHDITERLDAELSRAPEGHVDIGAAVASGRRAVRRRRLAAGAAGLATTIVVGATAWAGLPGGEGRADDRRDDVAQQPTLPSDADRAPDDGRDADASAPPFRLERGELASYGPDGEVVLRKGWRVTQRITNPFRRVLPERSVGLELTKGGKAYWYLLDYDDVGMYAASDPAGKAFTRLQDWVADQVALQQGDEPLAFVELGPDGRLAPLAGVTIVEQRTGVDLGRGFAPAARTSVAQLDVDGKRWFVSARRVGGDPEYFPVDTPAAGTTLDAFIAYSRAQYASGEGVR